MFKFFCFITGDDYNMLKADTPESRKKVSALASVIFIPVIIWFANGYLLVSHVLQGSVWSAVIVATILSSLIFLIEKNIIMAHTTRSVKIFRYSLGVVIAILGAVFLDEVIFKLDVDQQLFTMNKTILADNIKHVEDSYADELARAQAEVNARHTAWQNSQNEAMQEADGTKGSGIKGVHTITRLKLAAAEVNKSDYEKAESALTALNAKIVSDKEERKAQVEKSLNDGALLNRIKALFHLVFSDGYMAFIYLLFTTLLFAMEFLVVFMKSAWPETNYERRLQLIEEIGRRRMEKIQQTDILHYDPARVSSIYKTAKGQIKNSRPAIFN